MVRIRRSALAATGTLLLAVAGIGAVSSEARPGDSDRVARPQACGGQKAPRKPDGGRYVCAFSDEFDGSTLNTDKWLVQETSYSAMTSGNDDCYVNDHNNLGVGSGTLRLTSRRQLEPFVCKSPSGDFTATSTAATVATRDRFTQINGRFEFRARMPAVTVAGAHAALWLYPQAHTYGPWPKSGEVDVAEWFSGAPNNVYPSVHYEGENTMLSTGYNCPVSGPSTSYHTYAVEWTPTSMRFFYDGQFCYEHAWTPAAPLAAPQPFDQPFYVVLTQVWGSVWNAVTPQTPNSASLYVDWVRVWR